MQIPCSQTASENFDTSPLFLIGLNHRTAPLSLREQLALTDDEIRQILVESQSGGFDEIVILATCNRLEIYAAGWDERQGRETITALLSRVSGVTPEQLPRHLYFERGESAIRHLMRVAAGADSMILGEAQILGQVGQAFALAQAMGSTGPVLSHLFTLAAHAGKRARSETEISRHITSVSHAAVYMAQSQVADLHRAQVLVVGSGEMAYLAAQALQRSGVTALRCVNRTYQRAEDLARDFGGVALDWYQLGAALVEADVVISATAAPHIVIPAREVEQALAQRNNRPLVMIDIALPRDIDENVSALPGVHYYDLDALNHFVEANVARRETALAEVEAIISEEMDRFLAWYQARNIAPVITALREKAVALAQDETAAALRRLGDLDESQQRVVELMAHRIVNKILHEPTVRLKAGANGQHAPCYASIVRDLFALDGGTGD